MWSQKRISWLVGDDGGDGTAGVASKVDGFKHGRFGAFFGSGTVDGTLKERNAISRELAVVFRQASIGLKNDCGGIYLD